MISKEKLALMKVCSLHQAQIDELFEHIEELTGALERLGHIHETAMKMWENEGTPVEQDMLVIKQRNLLERALERLELVSDDSESIFFVKSCQPIVNDIRTHLGIIHE